MREPSLPDGGRTVPLRPGVKLPDWNAVSTEPARRSLGALFDSFDMARRWSGIGDVEDRVWRALLTLYARAGKAPPLARLAAVVGVSREVVAAALEGLRDRDLVVLDTGGRITGAYPFSDRPTGHGVRLGRARATAMCAIDALGMGAMVDLDTLVSSCCKQCGRPVEIATRDRGQEAAAIAPEQAVVWSGFHYAGSCAASSLCTVQAFFCSDAHLDLWRQEEGAGADGVRLSVEEALSVGQALFVPMLRPARQTETENTDVR